MTEKELITKLKELRQIKPRQDWVVFTKSQIFSEEPQKRQEKVSLLQIIRQGFVFKPAFAVLGVLVIMVGVLSFARNSLPGDTLYPVKKIAEKSQAMLIAKEQQSTFTFKVVSKRLDDLTRIAQKNSVKNLASAIDEYQASVSEVAKTISQESIQGGAEAAKKFAAEIKKLEAKTEEVKSLGIEIGENEELNNVLAQIVGKELADLENKELGEEELARLNEAKLAYEEGDYSGALEVLLLDISL